MPRQQSNRVQHSGRLHFYGHGNSIKTVLKKRILIGPKKKKKRGITEEI